MITNPDCGWCKFKIGSFEGSPSYVTNVPLDLLKAFSDYYRTGCGQAYFDEEGSEFYLVLQAESVYVVAFRDEPLISLFDFYDINKEELAYELIGDIEKNIDKWADFLMPMSLKEHKACKNKMKQVVSELKQLLRSKQILRSKPSVKP